MLKSLIPLGVRQALGGRLMLWRTQRVKQALLRRLAGDAVDCNICHWQGAAFTDDAWHAGTICPNCGSQVRHRLLAAALDGTISELTTDRVLRYKDILHFAPERQLRERIRKECARYVTADFGRGDCDLLLDISSMPTIAGAEFDTIIACDVLEHVCDDHAAFAELYRILRPGGMAILTVPQADPPAATDEDATVISESERERRFGQKDHVRMYGDDFLSRLERPGFRVVVITEANFPPELRTRHVLSPPRRNSSPLATNHRRIYFASKPS